MFVDLKGFTGLSEALAPEDLLEWLRPFLDVATGTIIEHGGMVDDYFGDGIKANFGVPLARVTEAEVRDDAERAVRCAGALVRAAHALNSPERPPYRLRIGIHTGTVVSATVGSKQRSKYTSLGDTVNVAARLEAHAKDIAPSSLPEDCVLVSEATARLLDDRFTLVCLGEVALKGKAATVTAYRVQLEHVDMLAVDM
jgi:adenylate cyclase